MPQSSPTCCFSVITQLGWFIPPLSFLAIKIYGQEGAQLSLSTINLSWMVKSNELLSLLVSSQEDGRKWEESRG